MKERYIIPNLRNACRVLMALGQENRGCKVADLAKQLRIPATTTLRIMHTLALEGFARKVNNQFFLGPILINLGSLAMASNELRPLAHPVLQKLSLETDETAHLAVPCDDRTLIAAVYDSPHPLRAASSAGTLADLYCTATGKVFMAYLHAKRLQEVVAKHPPKKRTENSLTELPSLAAECERVRAQGYAVDEEEFNIGVRCLAAPVVGPTGMVVAAVGITASTARFVRSRIPNVSVRVKAAAAELSRMVGHQ